jgi:hypothetical protein
VVVAVSEIMAVAEEDKLEALPVKVAVVKEAAETFAKFEEAAVAVAAVEVEVVADKGKRQRQESPNLKRRWQRWQQSRLWWWQSRRNPRSWRQQQH